jgi:uncharacterized tellurite resistance protein B-like protein
MPYITASEKTAILRDLIALAKSDGLVSFTEMTYLIWVAQKLGVSQLELQQIQQQVPSAFDRVSPDQRLEQFHRLLHMMFIDTQVLPEEIEKCRELALNMGLEATKVDKLLHELTQQPGLTMDLEGLRARYEGM